MKYPTIFHLLSDVFKKKGVSTILIGGFAVNHYKVTRQTIDVDFLCTKEDYNKIKDLLENEGYKIYKEEENFIQLEDKKIPPFGRHFFAARKGIFSSLEKFYTFLDCKKSGLMDIDFMFVDKNTFNKIEESGREIEIAGQTFVIPSLFHLIALKLHSIKYSRGKPRSILLRKELDALSSSQQAARYSRAVIKNNPKREIIDFPDIIRLIVNNSIDVNGYDFKNLCLKYGTEELYKRITKIT